MEDPSCMKKCYVSDTILWPRNKICRSLSRERIEPTNEKTQYLTKVIIFSDKAKGLPFGEEIQQLQKVLHSLSQL